MKTAIDQAREWCLRWLAARPRTQFELRQKLLARGVEPQAAEAVLQRLRESGLVDDEKYARAFIRNQAGQGQGRKKLKMELMQKGIDRDALEAIISEETPADESGECEALARRRLRQYQSLPPETARRRLAGFLIRRGFEPGQVFAVVVKILEN